MQFGTIFFSKNSKQSGIRFALEKLEGRFWSNIPDQEGSYLVFKKQDLPQVTTCFDFESENECEAREMADQILKKKESKTLTESLVGASF